MPMLSPSCRLGRVLTRPTNSGAMLGLAHRYWSPRAPSPWQDARHAPIPSLSLHDGDQHIHHLDEMCGQLGGFGGGRDRADELAEELADEFLGWRRAHELRPALACCRPRKKRGPIFPGAVVMGPHFRGGDGDERVDIAPHPLDTASKSVACARALALGSATGLISAWMAPAALIAHAGLRSYRAGPVPLRPTIRP
jgi:hypothetical protein